MTAQGRHADDAVTYAVRIAAAWTWRLLILGYGLYVLSQIFFRIELVSFSFILALFFTSVLHPLEVLLRKPLRSRAASSAVALLVGLAALVGIGYFVAWQITDHSGQLGDQISTFVDQARDWLINGPLHLKSSDIDGYVKNIKDSVKSHQGELISGAIQTGRTVVEALGALLLILLSTFFLLRDGGAIWGWTVRLLPRQARERVDLAGRVGWRTLGGYMRGVVLIALFHGISITIVLLVVRVPLAAALGVLIFLGSFVPLIGLTVTGALCVVVTLLEHGIGAAVVVGVAIIVLVQLEAHLLQPIIMSRSVEVHPLAIALAVLTGTVLSGIVGALLAVPLVAFLNSTIHALHESSATPSNDSGFPVTARDDPGGDEKNLAEPTDRDRTKAAAALDDADDAAPGDSDSDDAGSDGERAEPKV
ncbi:MAG: AI-2E family transporter [Jatrophihabitans sp.]